MNKKGRQVKEGKYSGGWPTNLTKPKGTKKPMFAPKPKKMIRSG